MKKQKIIFAWLLGGLSVLEVIFIALFIANVMSLVWFLVLSLIMAVSIAIVAYLFVRLIEKIKKAELEKKKKEELVSSGNYMQDIYKILGIPPQYNKDGSLKNIYELLGIEPFYDENGNRTLTVYEMLEMLPKFDKNGKEIPLVFAIKNRVGRIAKVDISTKFLTRKLTPEEQEAKLIRETLEKKLKEAEEAKDAAKVNVIKKAIADQKQQKKKAAAAKKEAKGKGPVKTNAAKPGKITPYSAPKVELKVPKLFDTEKKGNKPKETPKTTGNSQPPKTGDGKETGKTTGNSGLAKEMNSNTWSCAIVAEEATKGETELSNY